MEPHKPQNGDRIAYIPEAGVLVRRRDESWYKLLLGPGEIGKFEGDWWLCCPCGQFGIMDHEVTINNTRVTVTPSVVCPAGCHYFIKDGVVTDVC